jgi:hypothetical protein
VPNGAAERAGNAGDGAGGAAAAADWRWLRHRMGKRGGGSLPYSIVSMIACITLRAFSEP